MTEQLENTMIRALNDDELALVAGGQRMEVDASRYTAPTTEVDILGWTFQRNNNTGAMAWWGVSLPGQPSQLIFGSE